MSSSWAGGARSKSRPASSSSIPRAPGRVQGRRARAPRRVDYLSSVQDLDWTFFSPAALIAPGERTGQFRTGAGKLIVDAQGNSKISAEDYAIGVRRRDRAEPLRPAGRDGRVLIAARTPHALRRRPRSRALRARRSRSDVRPVGRKRRRATQGRALG
ncbi:NADH(P)-binding family protein [Burkholderia thailandensis]|uniref:NADH(P)-binding family protein n=1 Tax=Burkholderia thailandensis TaxID=57975 RepID=A0AAW9D1E9_BURTH|nr:NADH(P)-binding family protein [Burkholderia thailandensis]